MGLAVCLSQQFRHAEAEPLYKAAVEGYVSAFSPDDIYTLDAVFNLATCVEAQGRLPESEMLYRVTVEGRERATGSNSIDTEVAKKALAHCLPRQGKSQSRTSVHSIPETQPHLPE